MIHKTLHTAVIIALTVKAVSTFMKNYLGAAGEPSSLWFHVSGISSGVFVVFGMLWAIVFFHGNNFVLIPRIFKILLLFAALLAVLTSLFSF